MEQIKFPILNLKISLSRVAFSIGEIDVYWYAVIIAFAIFLFLITAKKRRRKYSFSYEDILNLTLLIIPISFLCARLYYLLFSSQDFSWKQLLNFRDGGIAIYGGILGGMLTLFFYCKKKKIAFLEMTDFIVPYLALGQALGRWGNFINVEAYGNRTNVPWRMEILEGNNWIGVHPTFLYESLATLGIYIFLLLLEKRKKFPGEMTYYYLIFYSFARMIIEGLRSDSLFLFGVKISQLLSIFLLVISCILLMNQRKKGKKKNKIQIKQRKKGYES